MTAAQSSALLAQRPALRRDLLISRPMLRGPAPVHLIKDPCSGRRFEIRAKEHFILERLDGRRTLAQIGDEYAARFGARLGEPQWQQLLRLVYGRGLMADAPVPVSPPADAAPPESEPESAPAARPAGFLSGTVRLVHDAPAFIERIHRATGFARNRYLLGALALALLAMTADLAADYGELVRDAAKLIAEPSVLLAVLTLLWTSQALHELGHGVAGRAFGASVPEIGLRWHYGTVLMYCRVEDVAFFARRREQVATATAGVFVNLLILLPFWIGWAACPPGAARRLLGGLLLIGMAAALVNLLPLPPLDGYLALGYALGVSRLATESKTLIKLTAARVVGRGKGAVGYPTRLRLLYAGYGTLSAALALGLAIAAVLVSRRILIDHFGRSAGVVPVALVASAVALWAIGLAAAGSRKRARANKQAAG